MFGVCIVSLTKDLVAIRSLCSVFVNGKIITLYLQTPKCSCYIRHFVLVRKWEKVSDLIQNPFFLVK